MADAMKVLLKPTTFPKDSILEVVEGSVCFVGMATALHLGGQDVIVIARNIDALERAVMENAIPGKVFVKTACYKLVTLQYRDAVVDDEL